MLLKVDKTEIVATADGGGRMLRIHTVTVNPQITREGKSIDAGFKLPPTNIMLSVTGRATLDMITRNLAELVQATKLEVAGGVRLANVDFWFSQLQGKTGLAEITYEPEGSKNGKSYPEKNEIKRWLKQ
jgi:hypothetical protein